VRDPRKRVIITCVGLDHKRLIQCIGFILFYLVPADKIYSCTFSIRIGGHRGQFQPLFSSLIVWHVESSAYGIYFKRCCQDRGQPKQPQIAVGYKRVLSRSRHRFGVNRRNNRVRLCCEEREQNVCRLAFPDDVARVQITADTSGWVSSNANQAEAAIRPAGLDSAQRRAQARTRSSCRSGRILNRAGCRRHPNRGRQRR
jgi:hypothetical protein